MINLSMILMLTGLSIIVVGSSLYIIKELYEEWKAGFKTDVLIVLVFLIPIVLIAVGFVIYVTYK